MGISGADLARACGQGIVIGDKAVGGFKAGIEGAEEISSDTNVAAGTGAGLVITPTFTAGGAVLDAFEIAGTPFTCLGAVVTGNGGKIGGEIKDVFE